MLLILMLGCNEQEMKSLPSSETEVFEVAQLCPTLCDPIDGSLPGLLRPWDFPGKSTEVGCHFLLQRIFPTQGSDLSFLSPSLAGRFFTTGATLREEESPPK